MIWGWASPGRMEAIGSSRPMRLRSIHWKRAIEVMSLVAEPIFSVASALSGEASGAREAWPTTFS